MKESEPVITNTHTAEVGDDLYDILAMRPFAEEIPIETVQTVTLANAVSSDHTYWLDTEGHMFGPSVILADWEAAKINPIWIKHIKSIEAADLNYPIWIAPDGSVFDGMHRLTRAFLDGVEEIKVRKFKKLPPEALLKRK